MNGDQAPHRAIGIRVSPREVHYAVVEGPDDHELIAVASVVVPPALTLPQQLHFIRTTVMDIMVEYEVRRAGIRLTEPTAKSISIPRLNIEGVIQELLSSSDVEAYFAGPIATIASRLGETERSRVKQYFEGNPFLGVDEWTDYSREERESIVTAVAAARLPARHA